MNWTDTPRWARHVATLLLGVFFVFTASTLRSAFPADIPTTPCRVVSVTDGDTLRCMLDPPLWGPYRVLAVRVAGIDTPESRKPPARCVKEVRLGKIAKSEMQRRVKPGAVVGLVWSGEAEKYGRVLAYVTLPDGNDWAGEMIRLGMARHYTSGSLTKSNWCK